VPFFVVIEEDRFDLADRSPTTPGHIRLNGFKNNLRRSAAKSFVKTVRVDEVANRSAVII